MSIQTPSIGWSDFARRRHVAGGTHAWFAGTFEELLDLVREHWSHRRPGAGRTGLGEVVVVPVPAARFVGSTILVTDDTPLFAVLERRQPPEEPYIRLTAGGPREPARFAAVVLYSAATLLENGGERSGEYDWEVVSLQAGALADEPMHPVTMARNFLEKSGGTFAPYTAQEFAEAVWYWSRRAAAWDSDK
jgi:hypothetical protein